MKMRFKRFLSGFMAVATLASVIIQPVAVSASELEPEEIPFEQQYAELKDVQDSLDPDEIVKANDIELSWNALAGADSYAILRDGQIIAETNEITYVDNNKV